MSIPDAPIIGLLSAAPVVTAMLGADQVDAGMLVDASSGGALLVMGLYLSRRIQDESARTRELLQLVLERLK